MARNLILSLAGGLVLFVWGFVSHVLLPWYGPAYHAFTDEAAVVTALERYTPTKGLYYVPFTETERGSGQLEAFVNVVPEGAGAGGGAQLAGGLIVAILSAFLVVNLVGRARPEDFRGTVMMFSAIGLAIGFVSHAYYWNWFQFPTSYVIVTIVDTLVGWTLVGLVVSPFMRRGEPGSAR